MKKISSLLLILLTALAVMSCDKEDNDVNNADVNNGKRLLKTVYYDENDMELSVEEWTYGNNSRCMTAYRDGAPSRKTVYLTSEYESSMQHFTWNGGNWSLQVETITKMDKQGRTLSMESRLGSPSYRTDSAWYTYSGDSTIVVSSINGQVAYKNVTVHKGNTTESIRYSYSGDNLWKEMDYQKTILTFMDGDNAKPLSRVIYGRNGNVLSRHDFEWNGRNYKTYLTSLDGVRYLHTEQTIDGDTSTVIRYSINTDDETPVDKSVTRKMGSITEQYSYGYIDGDWVFAEKKVDFYEE